MTGLAPELSQLAELGVGGFRADVQRILTFLQDRYGFGLWMFTRVEGGDWIVVQAADRSYGVEPGTLFKWSDSFCSRMVQEFGPRVAPDSEDVPAYAEAEIGRMVAIRAYVGVPISKPDGGLFGTLCAIDPSPKDPQISDELPLFNLLGYLIARMIERELAAQLAERRFEEANHLAETDSLTQLRNRQAWTEALKREESRASVLANPVAIIICDLDDLKRINDSKGHSAGDQLLVDFSRILEDSLGEVGHAYRIGGDEFGCILPGSGFGQTQQVVERLRIAASRAKIGVSIGLALRSPSGTLSEAWEMADRLMYLDKQERHRSLAA